MGDSESEPVEMRLKGTERVGVKLTIQERQLVRCQIMDQKLRYLKCC